MKASKTLASAIAAAAVVGAIGLAYAQTPDAATQPVKPAESGGQTMQNQSTTTPDAMQTPAASTTDTAGFQGERPAQADRN
ncbi:hypothetical protein [Polaromonas sp.]|uniref:hypothetical protein n=1 Tax=Polaromonas sp. TaxID=1869339 RepID=UPI002869F106|nr:hypothetical protein [Polaromonas sp.]